MKLLLDLISATFDVPDTQVLSHYMRSDHFLDLVKNRTIHANRLDLQHKDPGDGSLPVANLTKEADSDRAFRGNAAANAEVLRTRYSGHKLGRSLEFIHSWTMRAQENRDFWRIFGHAGRGVCIVSSVGRLKASIGYQHALGSDFVITIPGNFKGADGVRLWVEVKGVVYTPEDQPLPTVPAVLCNVRKRPEFSDEKEVRLIAGISLDDAYRFYDLPKRPLPEHQNIPVALEHLFESVIVGPEVEPADAANVIERANAAAGRSVARSSTFAA